MLSSVSRVLVLEPHPDDLAIGCSGLVQRLADQGAEVRVLLMSEVPSTYRKIHHAPAQYAEYAGVDRMQEAGRADELLGVRHRSVAFGPEWHHRLDALPTAELIQALEEHVRAQQPDLVLVPARSYNQDHRAVFDAFQAVMRPHFYRGMVLAYETTMERDFEPTVLVPLSEDQLQRKLAVCEQYQTQLGCPEHLFSLETIELSARYRGRLAYTSAAEAFQLLRGIHV